MSRPSYATRGEALRGLAVRVRPIPAELPYYLHTPRGPSEPAPGWYWRPSGAPHPQYLGYNHYDAYARLRAVSDAQHMAGPSTAAA